MIGGGGRWRTGITGKRLKLGRLDECGAAAVSDGIGRLHRHGDVDALLALMVYLI